MPDQSQRSPDYIRTIAWRAQTIGERIEQLNQTSDTELDESEELESEQFVSEWIKTAYDGDRDAFEKRLDISGITVSDCKTAYITNNWPSDIPIPSWAENLQSFIADMSKRTPTDPPDVDTQPFGHIIQSWVEFAHNRLNKQTDTSRLSQQAIESLKQWLFSRLSDIASRALYVEFRTFAAMRDPDLLVREGDNSKTEHYNAFTQHMHTEAGLISLFTEFPVLARLLQTTIRQWVSTVAEFNHRLKDDWLLLQEACTATLWPEMITDIEVLTGDRHQDGRAVIRVDITDAQSVIYKPRSTSYESVLYDLLSHVYEQIDLDIKTAWVLNREDYGWVEYVSYESCETTKQVHRYYRRAGILLGLAYFLYFNDCHHENVIAHGEYPFVADAETIFHPKARQLGREKPLNDELDGSILWTELLPKARSSEEFDSISLAGLSWPSIPNGLGSQKVTWKNINADGMKLIKQNLHVSDVDDPDNLPSVNGTIHTIEDYVFEILSGFDTVVTIVLNDHCQLVPQKIERRLENLCPRYIHRSTRLYASIIKRMADPEVLQDGGKLTHVLDTLIVSNEKHNHNEWKLHATERAALLRLDVPRFTMCENGDISAPENEQINQFVSDRTESSRDRRADPDPRVIQKQRELIQAAINPAKTPQPTLSDSPIHIGDTSVPDFKKGIKDIVNHLYSQLTDTQQMTANDPPTWTIRANTLGGLDVRLTKNGLYHGRAGIAIFFALVSQQLGIDGAADAAHDALKPLYRSQPDPLHQDQIDLGIASGIGGHIYALTFVGRALDDSELIDRAIALSSGLNEKHLYQNNTHDVLEGTAGLLLGLLALYEQQPKEWLYELLVSCGDHLVKNRIQTDSGYQAWDSELGTQPLTGFSHGVAGIAYALTKLSKVTKAERFSVAAQEAVTYEQSVYNKQRKNWPDFRDEPVTYMDAWCHGRTGIVLSRIGILDDINHAHEQTLAATDAICVDTGPETDQLCCGNAGRIDALIALSEATNDNRFYIRANQLATQICKRADQDSSMALPSHGIQLHNPTLFQGISGVGYALLRLLAPSDVPCLLLWE